MTVWRGRDAAGVRFRRAGRVSRGAALLVAVAWAGASQAQPLATFEHHVVGARIRVSPAELFVPKNIPGSLSVGFTTADGAPHPDAARLAQGLHVEAVLRGPAFPAYRLLGLPGEPLMLPPIPLVGDYQIDDEHLRGRVPIALAVGRAAKRLRRHPGLAGLPVARPPDERAAHAVVAGFVARDGLQDRCADLDGLMLHRVDAVGRLLATSSQVAGAPQLAQPKKARLPKGGEPTAQQRRRSTPCSIATRPTQSDTVSDLAQPRRLPPLRRNTILPP